MKLFIVGANGKVGQHVVRQALEAGHEVTAFVRHQGSLLTTVPNLSVVIGDVVHEYSKLQGHIAGHDAVVSALGNGLLIKGNGGAKIMRLALSNISQAMQANNVRRITLVLSYGSGKTLPFANLPIRLLAKTFFRKDFIDLTAAEDIIAHSNLDWTIGYFPALTDGPLSRQYSISTLLHTPESLLISRADLASFLLEATVDSLFIRKRVVLSGPKKGRATS